MNITKKLLVIVLAYYFPAILVKEITLFFLLKGVLMPELSGKTSIISLISNLSLISIVDISYLLLVFNRKWIFIIPSFIYILIFVNNHDKILTNTLLCNIIISLILAVIFILMLGKSKNIFDDTKV